MKWKYCPYCGEEINQGWKYCPCCGGKLSLSDFLGKENSKESGEMFDFKLLDWQQIKNMAL